MNDSAVPARLREVQRDARAWSEFSGMKYTRALRLMEHPLAQGILGERLCARDVIRVLGEHPVLTESVGDDAANREHDVTGERASHLGRNGLYSREQHPFSVAHEDDYLRLVLTAEVLRMFESTRQPNGDTYSYNLKHTAETFLGEHLGQFSYVANGDVIWAAAALSIPIAESAPGEWGPNADVGLVTEQVRYARSMRRSSGHDRDSIRAHHHRPPGYLFLTHALQNYRDTGAAPGRWNGVDEQAEAKTSPFHEWLVKQARPGERGVPGTRAALAGDYAAGVSDSNHGVVLQPEQLVTLMRDLGADEMFVDAARDAVLDWAMSSPQSAGIRTELIDRDRRGHPGWGAGGGTIERYEFRCPCGAGTIVEEHENIPGFREHSKDIVCATCIKTWEFVPGLAERQWRVRPVAAPLG
ncbi:MAG: hypothetical protein IJO71_08050 [Microbacterium sp.]|uniref:hypothetical protein n=1 Tax=Microbacterium sp. TaxID=51671 RepID=UPI0025CC7BA6|nr:hypothetical protein [Microbacterium sp.]MBQ9917136.1 hypothetical protein [Microbacterium sp.]